MTDHVAHYSVRWLSFELSHPRERLRILAATADSRYRRMLLRDKNGKSRPIMDPCVELEFVQSSIRERLLLPIPLSPIVYSDVAKGKTLGFNLPVAIIASRSLFG